MSLYRTLIIPYNTHIHRHIRTLPEKENLKMSTIQNRVEIVPGQINEVAALIATIGWLRGPLQVSDAGNPCITLKQSKTLKSKELILVEKGSVELTGVVINLPTAKKPEKVFKKIDEWSRISSIDVKKFEIDGQNLFTIAGTSASFLIGDLNFP